MVSSDFRIILVGGGPVGLVAAHVFAAAGIDFVLLEQRATIVPPQGAGIVLFPHTQRVLEQLGLMNRIREIAHEFSENRIVNSWGWHFHTTYTAKWTEENHAARWLFLHRPELLRVLYESLPESIKQHVYPGRKVEDIEVEADSIVVTCAAGTEERGSIVVGADGVHSRVRKCMNTLARQQSTDQDSGVEDDNDSLTSTYRCLYGNTGPVPGLELGPEWDLHSSGIAMQLFGSKDMCWFLFYDKLPQPTKTRQRYTEDEVERLAKRVADVYVTNKVQFKTVWDARKWAMMADLPEGIIENWHWKRIVLVGDAGNKQTPNIGQGWNCGVQDIVILSNKLRESLDNNSGSIGEHHLQNAFEAYREARRPHLEACISIAAGATRAATWDTWSTWIKDRLLGPWLGDSRDEFRQAIGTMISKGQILDFVAKRDKLSGLVPWQHTLETKPDASN